MHPSRLVTRIALGLGLMLLASCAAANQSGASTANGQPNQATPSVHAPSPTGIDFANRTPSPECFNPPPEVAALITQSDPLSCYGGADVTVDALVMQPGAFSCPGQLEPRWFHCLGGAIVELQPVPETGSRAIVLAGAVAAPSRLSPPSMFAHIHPDTGLVPADVAGQVLRITGHYDDPAAATCHWVEDFPDGDTPTPDETIRMCRVAFVIIRFDEP